jgi:4-hydroxybutyrate dehydrogenase
MLKSFRLKTEIHQFETCKAFVEAFSINSGDVILTNPTYYEGYFDHVHHDARVIYYKNFGSGEPTEPIVEALYKKIEEMPFNRMIAIGGGSIIDIAKLLVQETVSPVAGLYEKVIATKKVKNLIVIPTTCGTGSEVTSVSVIDVISLGSKMGLQTDDLYPDHAVLIPEIIRELPYKVFATSSIDALIHAIESYLSPKATSLSEMFATAAIKMILEGYREIEAKGKEARQHDLENYLLASTYAGISFGNAGCAAVHAMSMPLGGMYHVAHGESNYCLLLAVLKYYEKVNPMGKIERLKALMGQYLQVTNECALKALEDLLEVILSYKTLREYGVGEDDLHKFRQIVMEKQGRLMANNYTSIDSEAVLEIYQSIFK